MLSDPKKLRTKNGYGFLVSWRDRWRNLDQARAEALVERLLDEPGNLEELRRALGRPNASREDIAQWLAGALAAGSIVALRTRRREPVLDAPQETNLRDLARPDDETVRPAETTWLELRIVDERGRPVPGVPVRIAAGDTALVETDASGSARWDSATTSFGQARIADSAALYSHLRARWQETSDDDWIDTEGRPHMTVTGTAEPLPSFALEAKTPHTWVVQPRVGRARVVGGMFHTNKAFLLPDALPRVREVVALYGQHPGSVMLVVGHTDTSGDPDLNLQLSLDRARVSASYLADEVDVWLSFYDSSVTASQRWGDPEDALLLERGLWARGLSAGGDAVRTYQAARDLEVDGDIGPQTRRALIEDYMGLDGTTLPADVRAQIHGCGEHCPLADDGVSLDVDAPDGVDDPTDRRVEFVFFDAPLGVLPAPSSPTDPGPYPSWGRRAIYTRDMLVVRPLALAVRVVDADSGESIPGSRVALQGMDLLGAGDGTPTDAFGVSAFIDIAPGTYQVHAQHPSYATGQAQQVLMPGDPASVVTIALKALEATIDVELALAFADPEGKPVPFPAGWSATARMQDGSEHVAETTARGRLSLPLPRAGEAFTLDLQATIGAYVLVGGGQSIPGDEAAAMQHAREGGRFVRLPDALTLEHVAWSVDGTTKFDGVRFHGLEEVSYEIGRPDAPVPLVLQPVWQHFVFEFFDRYHEVMTSIPEPHGGGAVLALEGYPQSSDQEEIPTQRYAHSLWTLEAEAGVVHCVAWIATEQTPGLPDQHSMARFTTPEHTFAVAAEDGPGTWSVETLAGARLDEATTPSAAQLRYYDLPTDWRSYRYWVRKAGERAQDKRRFELRVTERSTTKTPYVVSLDDLVLGEMSPSDGLQVIPRVADLELAILDWDLQVYRPGGRSSDEPYFSLPAVERPILDPAIDEKSVVLIDHPPTARVVIKGDHIHVVGAFRTTPNKRGRVPTLRSAPIGARIARRPSEKDELDTEELEDDAPKTFSGGAEHRLPGAASTQQFAVDVPSGRSGTGSIGRTQLVLLRCCGRIGTIERFGILQRARVHLDFAASVGEPLVSPRPSASRRRALERDITVWANGRWNPHTRGHAATYEVGSPVAAYGHHRVLVQRGLPSETSVTNTKFAVAEEGRPFVASTGTSLLLMEDLIDPSRMTVAHEVGHILGLPDEYAEPSKHASFATHGIVDRGRSPGAPYSFDDQGMMGAGMKRVRARYFWWFCCWLRDKDAVFRAPITVVHRHDLARGTVRYTLADETTEPPAFFPIAQTPNVTGSAVDREGLCDVFVYQTGLDGFTGGRLRGSKDDPFESIAVVRIKFALNFVDNPSFNRIEATTQALAQLFREHAFTWWRVETEASFDGIALRGKVLISPRFIVRTYPQAPTAQQQADRRAFFAGLSPKLPPEASPEAYAAFVDDIISTEHVHAQLDIVESGRTKLLDGASRPRQARLRTSKGKLRRVEAVRLFAKLIGLRSAFAPTGRQFERALETAKPTGPGTFEFTKVRNKL